MSARIAEVRKFLIALAGAVGVLVIVGLVNDQQAAQIATVLTTIATALGVYAVPNTPPSELGDE